MSAAKRGSLAGLQPLPAAPPPLPARPAASPPAEIQTPVQRTPEVRSTEVQTSEVQTSEVARTTRKRRPKGRPAAPVPRVPPEVPGLPKYLRLERKELLIWPDQITNLSILARVLNRNRGGAGERITTNTLIRVAAALLLSRSQDLEGTTEEELRRSLGLPDLQTPYLRSLRVWRRYLSVAESYQGRGGGRGPGGRRAGAAGVGETGRESVPRGRRRSRAACMAGERGRVTAEIGHRRHEQVTGRRQVHACIPSARSPRLDVNAVTGVLIRLAER